MSSQGAIHQTGLIRSQQHPRPPHLTPPPHPSPRGGGQWAGLQQVKWFLAPDKEEYPKILALSHV